MMSKYIDADVLKDKMFNYYDCVNLNTRKDNYNGETLMNYEVADMIENCIDNAPIVDVQEIIPPKKEFKPFEEIEEFKPKSTPYKSENIDMEPSFNFSNDNEASLKDKNEEKTDDSFKLSVLLL